MESAYDRTRAVASCVNIYAEHPYLTSVNGRLLNGIAVTISVIGDVSLFDHFDFRQASHFRFNPGHLADRNLGIPRRILGSVT
jgi:hypothetical protein